MAVRGLRKRAARFVTNDIPVPNNNLNEFLTGIVGKFRFSYGTHALGLYIFYGVVTKRLTFSYNQLLYGSVSLLLAAKCIEKDPLVPRMPSLRKAACSYLPLDEYTRAERVILDMLEYNLEMCTFVTFIDYYLSSGILFTSELSESFDVARLENLVLHRTQELIKNGRFLNYPPEKLAVYVVGCAREQLGLAAWNGHLEQIGLLKREEVADIMKQLDTIQRPQVIPLQYHSVNIIKVKELHPHKKIGLREHSRESLRDSHKNRLTIITNERTIRDAKSVVVLQR